VSKVFKILLICCITAVLIIAPGNFFQCSEQHKELDMPTALPFQLTAAEKTFLETHQPIRIAFDGYFPPYSFIKESGELAGISYDTIQLISQKLNIHIQIDSRFVWKDIYQATLDKEIDVIATMVNRPEREDQFAFTRAYVFKSLVIITHSSNHKVKDRSDLSGKTVVLMKNYRYSERILNPSFDF